MEILGEKVIDVLFVGSDFVPIYGDATRGWSRRSTSEAKKKG